jgi:hypothetical protein
MGSQMPRGIVCLTENLRFEINFETLLKSPFSTDVFRHGWRKNLPPKNIEFLFFRATSGKTNKS